MPIAERLISFRIAKKKNIQEEIQSNHFHFNRKWIDGPIWKFHMFILIKVAAKFKINIHWITSLIICIVQQYNVNFLFFASLVGIVYFLLTIRAFDQNEGKKTTPSRCTYIRDLRKSVCTFYTLEIRNSWPIYLATDEITDDM